MGRGSVGLGMSKSEAPTCSADVSLPSVPRFHCLLPNGLGPGGGTTFSGRCSSFANEIGEAGLCQGSPRVVQHCLLGVKGGTARDLVAYFNLQSAASNPWAPRAHFQSMCAWGAGGRGPQARALCPPSCPPSRKDLLCLEGGAGLQRRPPGPWKGRLAFGHR